MLVLAAECPDWDLSPNGFREKPPQGKRSACPTESRFDPRLWGSGSGCQKVLGSVLDVGPSLGHESTFFFVNPSRSISRDYLHSLDALRGLAAVLVLLQHASLLSHNYLDADFLGGLFRRGSFRIDVFFVLSGFFAVWTSKGERGAAAGVRFWFWRMVRLAPLLWVLTSAKLVLIFMTDGGARHGDLDLLQILRSYTMIPAAGYPVILPAWTLSLELVFSSLWTLAMILGRRWGGVLIGGWLGFIVGCGVSGIRFESPWLAALGNPYMLEFLAGTAVAWILRRSNWGGKLALVLGAVGLGLLAFQFYAEAHEISGGSFADRCLWGLGVLACILGLAVFERSGGFALKIPAWWKIISRSSYAIYLSHSLVLVAGFSVLTRVAPISYSLIQHALVGTLALVSLAAGVLVHRWVEAPIQRWLKR